MEGELFKTTLMGGYDKEEVEAYIAKLKAGAAFDKQHLTEQVQKQEKQIKNLSQRLVYKEEQKCRLEKDIEEKYQKYIDHYDQISKIILDSQIRCENTEREAKAAAENLLAEAKKKAEEMLENVEKETQKKLDAVQLIVDERLTNSKNKYSAVQNELDEINDMINEVQDRFSCSCSDLYDIIKKIPDSMQLGKEIEKEEV